MSNPKQVIILRKDLNMRKGKMVAQGAHASMKVILDEQLKSHHPTPAVAQWLAGSFTKICCSVDSEDELIQLYQEALSQGIPCAIIKDAGHTEFNGVPTLTAVAIGPEFPHKIDPITKHLKLL